MLYGDRIRSRRLDVFSQVPCMVGESGSMSGRRMLPHSDSGILIAAPAGARVVVPDVVAGADGSGQRDQGANGSGPRRLTQVG